MCVRHSHSENVGTEQKPKKGFVFSKIENECKTWVRAVDSKQEHIFQKVNKNLRGGKEKEREEKDTQRRNKKKIQKAKATAAYIPLCQRD